MIMGDSGILKNTSARNITSRQSVTFRENLDSYRDQPSDINTHELARLMAARVIERAWLSHRDRKMFKLIKHATCAAEASLSYEILRKISPKEAQLLKDKGMPVKVRFRYVTNCSTY